MDSLYRTYFVVAIVGMFCWLNGSVVSAQTATDLDCAWCVGPGELGWDAVGWWSLDPSLRQALQEQFDQINTLQEQLDNLSDPAGVTVLDFTDPDACVIDQPGHYVLDRNWSPRAGGFGNMNCHAQHKFPGVEFFDAIIEINVGNRNPGVSTITLDLRNFGIFAPRLYLGSDQDLIHVTGSGAVTILNGRLHAPHDSITAVDAFVRLKNVSASSPRLLGGCEVRESSLLGTDIGSEAATIGSNCTVQQSTMSCFIGCLHGSGANIVVRNNIIRGGDFLITLFGDGGVIEGNYLESSPNSEGPSTAVRITGDGNLVLRNTITIDIPSRTGIQINGASNVIDSNVVRGGGSGIVFTVDGNFYGDNRVSATTPFDLGGTTQTDWGGNVSF